MVTSGKDTPTAQGGGEDQGGAPSDTKSVVSVSSTQLVYMVADLDRLQEQVSCVPQTSVCGSWCAVSVSESCRPKADVIWPLGL